MARRPRQVGERTVLTAEAVASASYRGSAEHKAVAWWGGRPFAHIGRGGQASRPKKQHTTICPLNDDRDRLVATAWVQAALAAGQIQYREGDKVYPSRIWYRDAAAGSVWIGYCINGILGEYKGWPISEDERLAIFG